MRAHCPRLVIRQSIDGFIHDAAKAGPEHHSQARAAVNGQSPACEQIAGTKKAAAAFLAWARTLRVMRSVKAPLTPEPKPNTWMAYVRPAVTRKLARPDRLEVIVMPISSFPATWRPRVAREAAAS